MKKVAISFLLIIFMFSLLTACGGKQKAKKFLNKTSAMQEDISSSTPDITTASVTTSEVSKDPGILSTTSSVTQTPSSGTQAPKVTTKLPQTTIYPSTTQPKKQPLILPTQAQCQIIENEIMRLVNQYRVSLGLQPYVIESKIIQGARIRAKETLTYCSHSRPNPDVFGSYSWGTVLDQVQYGTPYQHTELVDFQLDANGNVNLSTGRWVTATQYDHGGGQENLAPTSSAAAHDNHPYYNNEEGHYYFYCTTAELKAIAVHVFEGLKASPDHNKGMISKNLTKMGVGVVADYEYIKNIRSFLPDGSVVDRKVDWKDIQFRAIQIFTSY